MNALPKDYGQGVSFTVPGRPVAHSLKKRIYKGGFAGFYLSPECLAYERAVVLYAQRACRVPLEGPVSLTLRFYVRRVRGKVPDCTNLQKSVEDACKHVAFGDDTWVCEVHSRRKIVMTHAEERVSVRVRMVDPDEWPDD
jgi:Holliday junction resolvase RusA-like endonuclease